MTTNADMGIDTNINIHMILNINTYMNTNANMNAHFNVDTTTWNCVSASSQNVPGLKP